MTALVGSTDTWNLFFQKPIKYFLHNRTAQCSLGDSSEGDGDLY